MFYTNPLYGSIRTLWLFITGRVKFNKSNVGNTLIMEDGKTFTIFRRGDTKKYFRDTKPKGLFIIYFTPKMDIQKNIRLSRIMLFIFMGFKGFRSKYWCVNEENGECLGVYEWQKLKDAKRYSESIAVTVMNKRSVPGTVSFKVLENIKSNQSWKIVVNSEDEKSRFKAKYNL